MKDPGYQIIFRNLGKNVPPGWLPNKNWLVEYHADDRGFPLGVAWVLYAPPPKRLKKKPEREKELERAWDGWVKFVLVADDSRRQGIGTALVEAILERWPGVELSGAISRAGERLCRKFDLPPVVGDFFSRGYIAAALREGVIMEQLEARAAEYRVATARSRPSATSPRTRSGRRRQLPKTR